MEMTRDTGLSISDGVGSKRARDHFFRDNLQTSLWSPPRTPVSEADQRLDKPSDTHTHTHTHTRSGVNVAERMPAVGRLVAS